MPVACVFVPHFALRVAQVGRPELDGAPLVLGPRPGERPRVADATPEAAAHGVRPGLTLREATAFYPTATILTPDPRQEATIAEGVLVALEALSPLVEPAEPGCWYVDLHGLRRRLGPTDRVAALLLSAVPPVLRPRLGVAPGKFMARMASRRAGPGAWRAVTAAEGATFLAPLPVAWLPLPFDVVRRLERLGLRTLGDLAALPVSAVTAQFGPTGRRAWELANGRDDDPVRPRPRPETVVEALELPVPTISREVVLLALQHLALQASARPMLRGRGARRVTVRAVLARGGSWEKTVMLREPAAGEPLAEALQLRLGTIVLPGAVEALTLELSRLTAKIARQETLPGLLPRRPQSLAEAARQLATRYGASPLYRVVEVEPWSRIPERRYALMPFAP